MELAAESLHPAMQCDTVVPKPCISKMQFCYIWSVLPFGTHRSLGTCDISFLTILWLDLTSGCRPFFSFYSIIVLCFGVMGTSEDFPKRCNKNTHNNDYLARLSTIMMTWCIKNYSKSLKYLSGQGNVRHGLLYSRLELKALKQPVFHLAC